MAWQIVLPRLTSLLVLWALAQLEYLPVALAFAVVALDVLLLGWQLRRAVHLTDAFIRETGAMMASWGSYLLCFFAVILSLTLWWDVILLAYSPPEEESFDTQMRRAREALYVLEVAADGRTVIFDGEITYGLKARLEEDLSHHPNLQTLILSGPGGHVFEARGTAQAILDAGLNTRAIGECSSACTLLFLAGQQRSLAPEARLGFHGYGLAEKVHLPGYDIKGAQAKDHAFLLSRGVNREFANRAFATPPESMWYPSPAELRRAGVVND